MSDNGKVRPALNIDIPIVGQPCDVKSWFLTVMLECRCGAHEAVLIAGRIGATGQCAACRKVFVVHGLSSTASGHVEFKIAIALATEGAQADA